MVRNITLMKNGNTGAWIFLETMQGIAAKIQSSQHAFECNLLGFPYICLWIRLIKIRSAHQFSKGWAAQTKVWQHKGQLLLLRWGDPLGKWDSGNQGLYEETEATGFAGTRGSAYGFLVTNSKVTSSGSKRYSFPC